MINKKACRIYFLWLDGGLRRCHDGLLHPTLPQAKNNARLEALKTWADRLAGSKDPERWERVFRRGANLWRGLNFVYSFIESYGTGGGLCRSLFADFLAEAASALDWSALNELAGPYHELGQRWSDLADAALPDSVGAFRQVRQPRCKIFSNWRVPEIPGCRKGQVDISWRAAEKM